MAEKKKRNVQKGGFAVMEETQKEGQPRIFSMLHAGTSEDAPADTTACLKWIRDNAKDLDGKKVVIVQIKKVLTVSLENVQKVRLDIR